MECRKSVQTTIYEFKRGLANVRPRRFPGGPLDSWADKPHNIKNKDKNLQLKIDLYLP